MYGSHSQESHFDVFPTILITQIPKQYPVQILIYTYVYIWFCYGVALIFINQLESDLECVQNLPRTWQNSLFGLHLQFSFKLKKKKKSIWPWYSDSKICFVLFLSLKKGWNIVVWSCFKMLTFSNKTTDFKHEINL